MCTNPRKELAWAKYAKWDDEPQDEIPGAFDEAGKEDTQHRRTALLMESLVDGAPQRIHTMLQNLAEDRGMPFDLTLRDIENEYKKLNVNIAELLALRLYTGPMFESGCRTRSSVR